MLKNKKAQITIFVIVAIIIVVAILLFLLLYKGGARRTIIPRGGLEPSAYIAKCVKDNVNEAVNIMLPQGGYLEPAHYELHNNQQVGYICYTSNNYVPCVTQQPVYISFLENQITEEIEPVVQECFVDLRTQLQQNNYQISMGGMTMKTELIQDNVEVQIKREFTMTRDGETKRYYDFDTPVRNPLYNIAIVAQEIASQEAKSCYFEHFGFMTLYPEFVIDKTTKGEGIEIYSIRDKKTSQTLTFAIRSCVMPPGLAG